MADLKGADAMTEKKTFVEEGTQFRGSLTSNCPIVVKGRIEGDVAAPSLTVSPSGVVQGKVKVGELRSQGELAGEFDADTVQLSGTVKDNTVIRAKSLEVKLNPPNGKMQVIFGECALEVGELPSKEISPHASLSSVKSERANAQRDKSVSAAPPNSTKADGSMPPPPRVE